MTIPSPGKRNEVIAKAWKDPTFKKKLLKDPKSALKECGYPIPESVTVHVIGDTANTFTFVIPASPANVNALSQQELHTIAGGNYDYTGNPGCRCTSIKSHD